MLNVANIYIYIYMQQYGRQMQIAYYRNENKYAMYTHTPIFRTSKFIKCTFSVRSSQTTVKLFQHHVVDIYEYACIYKNEIKAHLCYIICICIHILLYTYYIHNISKERTKVHYCAMHLYHRCCKFILIFAGSRLTLILLRVDLENCVACFTYIIKFHFL